jgi:hypothetical protein
MIIFLIVLLIVYLAWEIFYLYAYDEESVNVTDSDLLEALGEHIVYNAPRQLYYPLSEQFDIILATGIYAIVYKRKYSFLFPYYLANGIGAVPRWWKSYKKIKEFHDSILRSASSGKTSSRHKLGL